MLAGEITESLRQIFLAILPRLCMLIACSCRLVLRVPVWQLNTKWQALQSQSYRRRGLEIPTRSFCPFSTHMGSSGGPVFVSFCLVEFEVTEWLDFPREVIITLTVFYLVQTIMLFAQLQMLILVPLWDVWSLITNVKLLAWCAKFTVDFRGDPGTLFLLSGPQSPFLYNRRIRRDDS